MRQPKGKVAGLALAGLAAALVAGCTSTGNSSSDPSAAASGGSHAKTTITVWSFTHLDNEVKAFKDSLNKLHDKYPWLTIKFVPNKDDAAFAKAVAAHKPPDVFVSIAPDNIGKFCNNKTVIDMNPYLKTTGVDVAKTFPAATLIYTQYQGKQCSLPLLTDGYALYYNKKMFADAGISSPPKTLSELTGDAKKLTVKNADGSIKTFGFIPRNDYDSNANMFMGVHNGSKFYDSDGKATFASDPKWADFLRWDKYLLDFYGANEVKKFMGAYQPHTDDEKNAFDTGVTAMAYAGEWHIGELADAVPDLDYGVAPMPVLDSVANTYGVGNTHGTVVFIPTGSKHKQEAFLAVQQLTTDTQFLNTLADAVSNIPSTFDSLAAWDKKDDPHWKPFIDIFSNSGSYYKELTAAGAEDAQSWGEFIQNYERGKEQDLKRGLASTAKQIDSINAQAK